MKRKWIILGVSVAILVIGLALAYFVNNGLQIPCLFNKLTGLLCPGCGNTRATLAVLRLDFEAMLRYNLFYPVQMLYVLYVYFVCAGKYIRTGQFSYHRKPKWPDYACLILVLFWTAIRNLLFLF